MEEGLLSGRSRDEVTSRSCSATLMVVFSTAVAACGSLAYGFAVSMEQMKICTIVRFDENQL